MTKIIWIDLDEVLAETVDHALEFHNYQICWKNLNKDDIIEYYIYKIEKLEVTKEEAINWFRKPLLHDYNLEILPVLWAHNWLKRIKEKWYKCKIVTARQSEILSEYTHKWIEKHFWNIFDDILFANHFTKNDISKSEICKNHWIEIMVEDNFEYALELAQNWIYTFLIEKPWNKNIKTEHKNIKKVKSWEEIII